MHSFSVEIKAHEGILARHSVNKLIVSAVVWLELVQMTGVTGDGGHALKFLCRWVVPPAE